MAFYKFEIIVSTKKEVLDPEGRCILEGLRRVGNAFLESVVVSKRFEIEIKSTSPRAARKHALALAGDHFANPVAQTFKVKRLSK